MTGITYLPGKYAAETRKQYLSMVESLVAEVMETPKEKIALVNHFIPLEEICYIGADTKTIYLYYREEWTLEKKVELTRAYDEKCQELFGDDKGMTIVIFKPYGEDEVMTGAAVEDEQDAV